VEETLWNVVTRKGEKCEKKYFTKSDVIGPCFGVSISAKFLDY
jgi:hypothetical protein